MFVRTILDRDSFTLPVSTNPRSIETGKLERTREACLVERHLEVVATVGVL